MTVPEWWLMFDANVGGGIRADQEAKERVKGLYLKFKEQERQQ